MYAFWAESFALRAASAPVGKPKSSPTEKMCRERTPAPTPMIILCSA